MLNQQTLNQIVGDLKGRRVMEIGCGTCEFANAAAKYCLELYAVDIEDKTKFIKPQSNLFFKNMDATKMDFRPLYMDVAVFYNSVGHLERELAAIIDECLRVLKEDGEIIVCSSQSYDRAVVNNELIPYLQKLNLDVKLSQYMTMQFVRVSKQKRIGINYKQMKELEEELKEKNEQ